MEDSRIKEYSITALNARMDENINIATSNELLDIIMKLNLSIPARKLLGAAIGQCEMGHKGFYLFRVSIPELASYMCITTDGVQKQLRDSNPDNIIDELMDAKYKKTDEDGREIKVKIDILKACLYDPKSQAVYICIHESMNPYLLNLEKIGNFTKKFLLDFGRLNSEYSMNLWNWMMKKTFSRKPRYKDDRIVCAGTLGEISEGMGLSRKLEPKTIKMYVKKAAEDIMRACEINIAIENIKESRRLVGLRFVLTTAGSPVPEKSAGFRSAALNKEFEGFIKWHQREFNHGKTYDTETIRLHAERLMKNSGGDENTAREIIRKTRECHFRQLCMPGAEKAGDTDTETAEKETIRKNINAKQQKQKQKRKTDPKDTQFMNFPCREYDREFWDRLEKCVENK